MIKDSIIKCQKAIEKLPKASQWRKGVAEYALELLETIEDGQLEEITSIKTLEKVLLNGADNWKQYSEGGLSLIHNYDIAKRLATPSELKKTDNGRKNPNARETWIDIQARALWQACLLIKENIKLDSLTQTNESKDTPKTFHVKRELRKDGLKYKFIQSNSHDDYIGDLEDGDIIEYQGTKYTVLDISETSREFSDDYVLNVFCEVKLKDDEETTMFVTYNSFDFESAAETNGVVKYNGKEIVLIDDAVIENYRDDFAGDDETPPTYHYVGKGLDHDGNKYTIIWQTLPDFFTKTKTNEWEANDDESNACDWDNPIEVKLD